MAEDQEGEGAETRKPWTKPVLKRFNKLSDEDVLALRAADDPKALLIRIMAEPGRKEEDGE